MSDEMTDNRDDEHEQPAPGPADHGGRWRDGHAGTRRARRDGLSDMQIGIDNFVSAVAEYDTDVRDRGPSAGGAPARGRSSSPTGRASTSTASVVNTTRAEFFDSAPTILLGAAAARTEHIRSDERGVGAVRRTTPSGCTNSSPPSI